MTRPAPTSSASSTSPPSHEDRGILLDVVRRTAEACFMPLTVGGGVRTVEDIRKLLLAGADKVSINTAAVNNPEFVREAAEKFGSQCIVVAIDAKKVSGPGERDRWEIFTHGGRKPTGIDAVAFAGKVAALGAGEILLTSMDRDGTKSRLRHRADPRHRRRGAGAGDRLRRRRHARPSGRRRARRPCQRRAGRLDLPFRRAFDRARPRRTWRRPALRCAWTRDPDVMAGLTRLSRCQRVRGHPRSTRAGTTLFMINRQLHACRP